MLYYDIIDICEDYNVNKTNTSKECIISQRNSSFKHLSVTCEHSKYSQVQLSLHY